METSSNIEYYRFIAKYRVTKESVDCEINFAQCSRDLFLRNLELKAKVKMLEHQLMTFSDNFVKSKKKETNIP